jgi:hypothetical protein
LWRCYRHRNRHQKGWSCRRRLRLLTSIIAQDALHLAEQGVKRSSTTVKVDRQQLINLLIDHGVLCAAVGVDNLDCPT